MADEGQPGTGPVALRLARVKAQLKRIVHSEAVKQGTRTKYTYTPTDDIKDVLRPLLAAEGVAIIPINVEVLDRQRYEVEKRNDNGTYVQVTYDLMVKVYWRISAGADNYETAASIGRSLNQDDKDPGAASTYAYRNLVAAVFDLSTGEDHEQAGHDAARQAEPAPAPKPARKQTGEQTAAPGAPKNPPSRAASDGDARPISDAQVKRLRTLATNGGWPDEALRRVFLAYGVPKGEDGKPSAKSVARGVYEDICTALEEPYPPLEEVRRELKTVADAAKMSRQEATDALRAAGVITSTINEIVGDPDKLIAALQTVTAAADAKAGS